MSEYNVTIEVIEKYTIKVEARTECDAIAKAFDDEFSWVYQYDAGVYNVKAEMANKEKTC